jgi:acetylornithine aminotransferase
VPLSPAFADLAAYPFVRQDEAKAAVAARGVELIDFGMGDPREPTPAFIREALVAALAETSSYPRAVGLPELRAAIAAWARRRFGADLDPATEIVPTLGSKEAIFSLAQMVVSPGKDVVVVPEPAYPVYERGALFAGAEVRVVALREEDGFLPRLDALDAEVLDRTAVFWVNYPNNPTGATAPPSFYEELAQLARAHDFVLASDEAYSELWFEQPPASALEVADRTNVLVFNTLSKRSSMTGYRSGFAAGDPALIAAMKTFRPSVGTAPQEFVQRAAIAAWGDEEHVAATRDVYRRKREVFLDLFARKGIRVAASEATMYLWFEVPGGEASEAFAARLLERGVVVSPGSYFGPAGEGYARLALVPTYDDCRRAAALMEAEL